MSPESSSKTSIAPIPTLNNLLLVSVPSSLNLFIILPSKYVSHFISSETSWSLNVNTSPNLLELSLLVNNVINSGSTGMILGDATPSYLKPLLTEL